MGYVMPIRRIRVSHIVLSTKDVADLLLENLKSCESNELMLKMFSKLAKKYGEDKKVIIRNIRRDSIDELKRLLLLFFIIISIALSMSWNVLNGLVG